MLYRKVKNIEQPLSALGFGCMRFPKTVDGAIDEPEAAKMLRVAFERGINYYDTAWPYHDGKCEDFVGRTLADVRDKIILVTKLPVWLLHEPEDMEKFLDKQLAALHTDYVDIYLFHGLSRMRWEILERLNGLDFIDRAKKSGKIKYTGFSFHDGRETFTKIIDAYKWDVCQIQYNLLDRNFQAGAEGMKYAASKGLGVVVMEPLKGGVISRPIPNEIQDVATAAGYTKPNCADLGLRWVWDQPEPSVVLSGMSSMKQLEQNLASVENSAIGNLTPSERKLADALRDFLESRMRVPCTGCKYCAPCPQAIDIPSCFGMINVAALNNDWEGQKQQYYYQFTPERRVQKPSACVQCRTCVEKCPQHIDIPARLKEVVEAFE